MYKDTKRALRRHHLARMKVKAVGVYYFLPPENAVKLANHIKVCSRCTCCGNPRKLYGDSIGERRVKQTEE